MKTLLFYVVAATLIIAGCGGGGGNASPHVDPAPVAATDIWEGTTLDFSGTEKPTTCLVSPGGEFFCANDEGAVLWGRGSVDEDGDILSAKVQWAAPVAQVYDDSRAGEGLLVCAYLPHEMLDCELIPEPLVDSAKTALQKAEDSAVFKGQGWGERLILFHKNLDPHYTHACFIRDYVRQSAVAGAWAPWMEEGGMLHIDRAGRAYGQNPETGCILNGTVTLFRDDIGNPLNLYKVRLLIEGCMLDGYDEYNDRALNGFGYLDSTQLHMDTLVIVARVRGQEGYAAWSRHLRRQ